MSFSAAVSAQIPYLRRFARALAGSQVAGDAYALAAVEAVVAEPERITAADNIRVCLYRTLIDVWTETPVNAFIDVSGFGVDEKIARRNLEAISLRPRLAFLLNALEGLDLQETAACLGVSVAETQRLIEAAGREIAEQIRTDVLIIEDEPLIALDLQALVEDLGHRVVATARTHAEALEAARRTRPGLILADIHLADGSSGLEAVNQILSEFEVPVIFVTAYPERFLTGSAPEPAFLVTKPFVVDSLKAVISQALFFDRRSHAKDIGEPQSVS